MSLKTYNIDVPITPGAMPPVIHIGQYDSGRDYICHLKNDDGTDYTIPSGTTATFTGCNPRKEVFELEATVDTGANTVTITPKDEATSMFGVYGATINLTLNDEQMSPILLKMDVQKAGATDEEIAGAANFPDAVNAAVDAYLSELIATGDLGELRLMFNNLQKYNAVSLIPNGVDVDASKNPTRGIYYTWDDYGVCTYTGTCINGEAIDSIINSPSAIPWGFVAGKTYKLVFAAVSNLESNPIQLAYQIYKNGTAQTIQFVNPNNTVDLALPSDTTGLKVWLRVQVGDTVDGSCTVTCLNTKTNQELAAENQALTTGLETALSTDEITANRCDMRGFILGVSSAGSANAARAMSAPMLVGDTGLYVWTDIPSDMGVKVDFYPGEALTGTPSRWYPDWKSNINEGRTGYDGTYCRIELHMADETKTITAADVAACKIYVVDGIKPIIYVPHRSAVDGIARNIRGPVTFRVLSNNASQLSFNPNDGTMGDLPNAEFIPLYKQKLYEAGANVAFFQEFPHKMDDGTTEAVDALLKPLFANVITANINTKQQMAIASNYPIVGHGEGAYTGSGSKYMWALLNIHGALVYVLNLHFTTGESARISEIEQAIALMKAWPVYFGGGDTNIGTGTGAGTETERAEYDLFHAEEIQTSNGGFVGLIPTSYDNVRSYDTFVACASVAMSQFSTVPNSTSYGTNHQMVICTMTLPLDGNVEVPVIEPELE